MIKKLCLYYLIFSCSIVYTADKSPTYEDFKNLRLALNAIAEQMGDKKEFEFEKEWLDSGGGYKIYKNCQTETGLLLHFGKVGRADIISPFGRIFLTRGDYFWRNEWWITFKQIAERIKKRLTLVKFPAKKVGEIFIRPDEQLYVIAAVDGLTMPKSIVRKEGEIVHGVSAKMKSYHQLYAKDAVMQHVPVEPLANIIVEYAQQD